MLRLAARLRDFNHNWKMKRRRRLSKGGDHRVQDGSGKKRGCRRGGCGVARDKGGLASQTKIPKPFTTSHELRLPAASKAKVYYADLMRRNRRCLQLYHGARKLPGHCRKLSENHPTCFGRQLELKIASIKAFVRP